MFFNFSEESKQQSQRLFLNLYVSRPRLKMYNITLESELKAKHAAKTQANFQGPFFALSSKGINCKCRLREEKQELMKPHVCDILILPGHTKLLESNRVA